MFCVYRHIGIKKGHFALRGEIILSCCLRLQNSFSTAPTFSSASFNQARIDWPAMIKTF